MFNTTRILSQPIPVRWLGWQSDTLTMQRMGWDLAVDYDPSYDRYRMMAHHPQGKLYGWAPNWINIPREWADPATCRTIDRMTATEMRQRDMMTRNTGFEFTHFGSRLEVVRIEEYAREPMRFQQIDAEPYMVHDFHPRSIEDFNVFRVKQHEEEIFIEEADMTVLDHLQAIKDLQSEDQARIRERMLNEQRAEPDVEIITHANILTLRSA